MYYICLYLYISPIISINDVILALNLNFNLKFALNLLSTSKNYIIITYMDYATLSETYIVKLIYLKYFFCN